MSLTDLIPAPYRILALVILAGALVAFGWLKGTQHEQHVRLEMIAKAAAEGVRIVTLRGAVTEKIVTKYAPAVERERVITETIVKEVPVYVSLNAPDLPGGFRVLVDAAAAGRVPDPASVPDAAPVPAQAATGSIVANYGTCRADQLRLQGLQEWVREQGKVR